MQPKCVIVIGGGASGLVAAGRAGACGADVLLLEKMEALGKKLLISGQSRCNVSHTGEISAFIDMYGRNGRFLYHAFSLFFRDELTELLGSFGVKTLVEPDGRIFPASNSSGDVLKALESYATASRVQIETRKEVQEVLLMDGAVWGVRTGEADYPASAVVLATGGASYPATGSSGAGYRLAAAAGHSIKKLRPALVPLEVYEKSETKNIQGASLEGVRLTAYACEAAEIPNSAAPLRDAGRGISAKKPRPPVIESRLGDVMLTHFGLSGPVVLLESLAVVEALESGPVSAAIDLRPHLTTNETRQLLQKSFDRFSKRTFRNILLEIVPPRLVDAFQRMSGVPAEKVGSQINADERERLVKLVKSLSFNIKGPLPLAAAMVTAGGISLDEIDPRSMGSRLVKGLYFCGEVMDINGDTGGYNLQAAFSTGHVAGESAAAFVKQA